MTSVPPSIYLDTSAPTTLSTLSERGNLWHHRLRERATAGASSDSRGDRKLTKCIAIAPAVRGGWLCPRGGIDECQKLLQRFDRIGIERVGDVDELDDAQATIAAFIFGDERLWLLQAVGDIALCEAFGLPQIAQQRL